MMRTAAMRRPGRFDHTLYVGLPDAKARAQTFAIDMKPMAKLSPDLQDREKLAATLAAKTEGYSGADIAGLCKEAGSLARAEGGYITLKHFEQALAGRRPSVTTEERTRYEKLHEELGGG